MPVRVGYFGHREIINPPKITQDLSSCPPINEDFCSRSRHVKKITTGICLLFRGLFFEHNAEIGPRLNIKYGFNWASKKTIYGWTLVRMIKI
ncbi:MAG: hypothetical protein BA867_08390 [Desulfobacterales bacterium S5133MH16]|nr:MAG: hypothetical protein BA867_08390 [Desulfobacterales bacterium S5133MH16]